MSERLNGLLSAWMAGDELIEQLLETPTLTQWVLEADDIEINGLLRFFESVPPEISPAKRKLLDRVLNLLAIRLREQEILDEDAIDRIATAYTRWGDTHNLGHLLLALYTSQASPNAIERFTELIVNQPPQNSAAASMAFVPLLRKEHLPTASLFPRILDGLGHLTIASLILDLANHVTRQGMVDVHPASDRVAALGELFSGLIARLSKVEESPPTDPKDFAAAQSQVREATSIALATCDALGQIGDASVVSKLKSALELRHRKIRLEAAAALARLDNEEGKEALVELVAEPVCRPRILSIAEDLGIFGKIPEQYRSENARVVGELSAWLAMETQFGLPPHELEVVDHRTLRWPGFEEPVDCHLVRYRYEMSGGTFESVGIVGPVIQSFAVDLTALAVPDIYAAFAGWQAEHPEVFELEPEKWEPNQTELAQSLKTRVESEGFTSVQPAMLAFFFGDIRLVAVAKDPAGQVGTVMADLRQTTFYLAGEKRHPIGPREAYFIHAGREFLRAFNQDQKAWLDGKPPEG